MTAGDVPDLLRPGLRAVFCGINPGRWSARAGQHFANPRNDFWRLLHAAGFTPRQIDPSEGEELVRLGYGITNAALRTTPGSGDLRSADFAESAARLERLARELRPLAIGFVGKEAYRGAFRKRPELGLQPETLAGVPSFVLPSTSPANAAVPWDERLRWFGAFYDFVHPPARQAVRALLLDSDDRVALVRFRDPSREVDFWATPGGGVEPGESDVEGLRRELAEETGLLDFDVGPCVWIGADTFRWRSAVVAQQNRFYLVRVAPFELRPGLGHAGLLAEGVHEARWWTLDEIERSVAVFEPPALARRLRELLLHNGAPHEPIDVGV